ncbi:MAG: hypothetical protein ABIK86_03800 [candidate division WOR-3 bacterium]
MPPDCSIIVVLMARRSRIPAPRPPVKVRLLDAALLAALVAVVFGVYFAVELQRNRTPGFPLDDPWIHLTFARNLAQGRGFSFNPGEPVAGSTAPLWTLILALAHVFLKNATEMVVAAKVLSAVFLVVASVYAFRLGMLLTGDRRAGLASGIVVATLGPMGWALMSGMEVTLSAALTLAGIYHYLNRPRGPGWFVAWVLFGLAALARPEALVLPGFVAIDALLRRYWLKEKVLFWRGVAVWLAVLVPYFVFNLVLSGSPFPQTFAAKASATSIFAVFARGDLGLLGRLFTRAVPLYIGEYAAFLWRINPVLALLIPVGLIGLVHQTIRSGRAVGFVVSLFGLGFVPVIGLTAPVFGPAFQSGRYVGNVTALLAVVAVAGGYLLGRALRHRAIKLGVIGVLVVLALFNTVTVGLATARNTAQATKSINEMQVKLGLWLRENTPEAATLGCNDIGAIGYLSGRKIIDLSGLVTKEILAYREVENGREQFIMDVRPDYLVIFPVSFPGFRNADFLEPLTYADPEDNTASLYDLPVQVKALAAILILDLVVEPARAPLVVFRCHW